MTNARHSSLRAKRFPIHAAVRYRPADSADWHDGRTENMSCSGALISGRHLIDVATPVEMLLPLPSQLSGTARMQVLCRGHVVRVAHPPLPMLRSRFAVRWRELSVLNGESKSSPKVLFQDECHSLIHSMYNEIAVIVGSSELLVDVPDNLRRERVTAIKQACDRASKLLTRMAAVLGRGKS